MSATELFAAAFGLLGALLLACKGRYAGWGFVAFLASNAGWIAFALQHGYQGLLWQQVGFTLTSLLGVWQWVIQPMRDRRANAEMTATSAVDRPAIGQ